MQKVPAVPRSGNTSQSPWKVPALPAGACVSPFTSRNQGTQKGQGSGLCSRMPLHFKHLKQPFPIAHLAWPKGGHLLCSCWSQGYLAGTLGDRVLCTESDCCSTAQEQRSCSPLTRRKAPDNESRSLACLHCYLPSTTSPSTAWAVVISHHCSDDPREHDATQKAGPFPKTTPLWGHMMQRTGPHALAIYQIILPAVSLSRWLWHPPGMVYFPMSQEIKSLTPLCYSAESLHKDPYSAQR